METPTTPSTPPPMGFFKVVMSTTDQCLDIISHTFQHIHPVQWLRIWGQKARKLIIQNLKEEIFMALRVQLLCLHKYWELKIQTLTLKYQPSDGQGKRKGQFLVKGGENRQLLNHRTENQPVLLHRYLPTGHGWWAEALLPTTTTIGLMLHIVLVEKQWEGDCVRTMMLPAVVGTKIVYTWRGKSTVAPPLVVVIEVRLAQL